VTFDEWAAKHVEAGPFALREFRAVWDAAAEAELDACCRVICCRCARGWPLVDRYAHSHPEVPFNENAPPWVCFAAELREQRQQMTRRSRREA
jgi:hypothetical protein